MLKNNYTLVIYLFFLELLLVIKNKNIGICLVMYSIEHLAAQVKHKAS